MNPLDPESTALLRHAAGAAPIGELRRLWLEHPAALQAWLPACLEAEAARALTDDGDTEAAFDLADIGKELAAASGYPCHEFERLQALALARSGSTREALRRMEGLLATAEDDALSYGLLARSYRDLALAAATEEGRAGLFLQGADWAEKGWHQAARTHTLGDLTNRAYLANQVAQFAFLGGDCERSVVFQNEVLTSWKRVEESPDGWLPLEDKSQFWWSTNLAEMALLRGDLAGATGHYRQMREKSQMMGHVVANAHVCRILLRALGRDPGELDSVLSLPAIVVCSGHMLDLPERPVRRFPVAYAPAIKERLAAVIRELGSAEGFVSASVGTDLLFAESLLEEGGRLHLVLPFSRAETIKRCVAPWGEPWVERFEAVLACAYRVKELEWAGSTSAAGSAAPNDFEPTEQSAHFAYANRVLLGMARLRAQALELPLQPVVVWDQSDRDQPKLGGTGDFAGLCHRLQLDPLILAPDPDILPER